ncbi:MAG: flagellar basal body L-ring protein FlgH [Bacteriovoracaceae bacterium]
MKMALLFLLTFLFGCSGYINDMHREMDGKNKKKKDNLDMYRKKGQSYDPKNPTTLSSSNPNFEPKIKRQYRPSNRRVQAKDLVDNDSNGSLWSSEMADGYLFARDAHKKNGDIIILKVQGKLKNEITAELKRAFPAPKKKKKPSTTKETAADAKKPAAPEAVAAKDTTEEDVSDEVKIYDQISSVISEEVNRDYVLIRGQKEVIFRSDKHLVEVQALVPRKDLMEDDSVLSASILESNVAIIR